MWVEEAKWNIHELQPYQPQTEQHPRQLKQKNKLLKSHGIFNAAREKKTVLFHLNQPMCNPNAILQNGICTALNWFSVCRCRFIVRWAHGKLNPELRISIVDFNGEHFHFHEKRSASTSISFFLHIYAIQLSSIWISVVNVKIEEKNEIFPAALGLLCISVDWSGHPILPLTKLVYYR